MCIERLCLLIITSAPSPTRKCRDRRPRLHLEPMLLKGGETVKSLSIAFLADLEEDWRHHGKEIFPILRAKYPQAYFPGIASLVRIIRWDVESTSAFNRTKKRNASATSPTTECRDCPRQARDD